MKILPIIAANPILQSIIKEHIERSTSLNAPYHNFYHSLVVTESCLEIIYSDYYDMSDNQKDELMIAALFHDFNHTMGKEKDDVNIKRAIQAFENWYSNNKNLLSDLSIDTNRIIDIIKATEYPYVIEASELNDCQKIIRDADLTQSFKCNRIQQIYVGLATEMNMTVEQIIEGQPKFLRLVKPNTEWFKKMYDLELPKMEKECEILLNCLK